MTGAGSATVAWAAETSYNGGVAASPTYREPGRNLQVQTAELSNNLLRILAPGDAEARRYIAQNLSGQFGVSFVLMNNEYHRLVFNDSDTDFTTGRANSAEWYLGLNYLDGTVERQLKGWFPASFNVAYTGPDAPVRVTLTGPYATEEKNTAITPGTISRTGTETPGHGADLSINSTTQTKLQQATLSADGMYRPILGTDREIQDAVNQAPEVSLTTQAVYTENDQLEIAYGSPGSSVPQSGVDDSLTASFTLSAGGATIADYTLSNVYSESYDWSNLVAPETDVTEPITWSVAGLSGDAP